MILSLEAAHRVRSVLLFLTTVPFRIVAQRLQGCLRKPQMACSLLQPASALSAKRFDNSSCSGD